jgi:hypothetical protein
MWRVYGYDVLFLALFLSFWHVAWPDFSAYSSNVQSISVSKDDMLAVAMLGLYGPRISIFIAIARHNRMPQTAEWLVTIIGLSFMILMWLFGDYLFVPYAGLHGYKFCSFDGQNYNFAKQAVACQAATH